MGLAASPLVTELVPGGQAGTVIGHPAAIVAAEMLGFVVKGDLPQRSGPA